MTEDEHILLTKVGNSFYEKYSKLIAEHINKMPICLHQETKIHLQELSNVFSSDYMSYLKHIKENE